MNRTHIDQYRLDENSPRKEGGNGYVYKTYDESLLRDAAIKEPKERFIKDRAFLEAFKREGQLAANFDHPNVGVIYHEGTTQHAIDGEILFLPYLAMEWYPNSVRQKLSELGKLDPSEVLSIGISVCDALAYGHGKTPKMIHRDIKPPNLLIDKHGAIRVCDFGLAVAIKESSSIDAKTGLVGTPPYIPPEVWKWEESDERSDIYSLGITLYELSVGFPPFLETAHWNLAKQHMEAPVPDIPNITELALGLNKAVQKATAKLKEDRYQTALEMKQALEGILKPHGSPVKQTNDQADALYRYMEEREKHLLQEMKQVQKLKTDYASGLGGTDLSEYLKNQADKSDFVSTDSGPDLPILPVNDYSELIDGMGDQEIDSKADAPTSTYQGLAFSLYNDGATDKALDMIRRSIDVEGGSPDSYLLCGWINEEKKLLDDAIKNYSEAIKIDPGFLLGYLARADAYIERSTTEAGHLNHDRGQATADYTEALNLGTSSQPELYVKRGVIRLEQEEYEAAIGDFSLAIEVDSNNCDAFLNRAESYFLFGNLETAVADYDAAEKFALGPRKEIFNRRAYAQRELGNYRAAIEDFSAALALSSDEQEEVKEVYRQRGFTHHLLKDYEKAISDYNSAIDLDKNYAIAYRSRADSEAMLRQYEDAVEDYETAINIAYTDRGSYIGKGRALAALGEHSRAISDFDEALRLAESEIGSDEVWASDPDLIATVRARADSLHVLDQHGAAAVDFTRIIDWGLGDADTYRNRGQCNQLLEEFEEAASDFSTAIDLDGSEYFDYIGLGQTSEELLDFVSTDDEFDEIRSIVLDAYSRAIWLDSEDPQGYGLRARFLGRFEDFNSAAQDYITAISKDVEHRYTNVFGHKALAETYWNAKEYLLALDSYTDALAEMPRDMEIYQYRGAIHGLLSEFDLAIQDFQEASRLRLDNLWPLEPDIPEIIGPYRVQGIAGEGGLSRVYKGTDLTDENIAIRVPHSWSASDPDVVQRLDLEARLLGSLQHQNIVRVLAHGTTEDSLPYVVMEYISDRLSLRIREGGALSAPECISIAKQLCDALAYIHTLGIAHTDIKPSNVLMTGNRVPKLTNFLLAKSIESSSEIPGSLQSNMGILNISALEGGQIGFAEGTMGYMSPEQLYGLSLDNRTDIYSLGATMVEMLTGETYDSILNTGSFISTGSADGHRGIGARDTASVVPIQYSTGTLQFAGPVPIPDRFDVPVPLSEIIMKALAPHRAQRYSTATEMRNSLDSLGRLGL